MKQAQVRPGITRVRVCVCARVSLCVCVCVCVCVLLFGSTWNPPARNRPDPTQPKDDVIAPALTPVLRPVVAATVIGRPMELATVIGR